MEAKKNNGKKKATFAIDEEILAAFKTMASADKNNLNTIVETLIKGYVDGEIRLKTATRTKIVEVEEEFLIIDHSTENQN